MNLVKGVKPVPLRLLMVNPLSPASQMLCMKILSGTVFGQDELIDLILLVYLNEVEAAEALKLSLDACAYSGTNSITVTSLLPKITDADIFCFITNFPNPNFIDFDFFNNEATFDTFYLLLKLAHNFSQQTPPVEKPEDDTKVPITKRKISARRTMKPIFMTDGLVPLDILSSFSKHIPADSLFCPTSLVVIAKSVLAEFLKVSCDVINDVLVWAANDNIFHVDIQPPCLTYDTVDISMPPGCTWYRMGKDVMESLNFDHTQFNASWLKKEYIQMIRDVASRHPYGSICKASEFSKALRGIWNLRINANNNNNADDKKIFDNFGVISDGSLGTIKGCAYVLPLLFNGDTWEVDKRFGETSFLKNEIKRMNKAAKEHHTKLIKYCHKFLDENVINQAFVQKEHESSTFSINMTSTSPRPTSETTVNSSPFISVTLASRPRPTPGSFYNDSESSDSIH